MNRRQMLKTTGAAIAMASIFGTQAHANENTSQKNKPKKALVIGAHPDDPETGCGGTMLMLKESGWDVVSVYMTKGERGIEGKSLSESAAIRVEEGRKASAVLGARPLFMTQIDGEAEVNKDRYVEMRELIAKENPDIVLTHWPIDSHPDHRVCSILVYDAWRRLGYNFELFYFEVMSGVQTQMFSPTDYVDISEVADKKKEACMCHASQDMTSLYKDWHDRMELFRGLEYRCKRAEAFIHLKRNISDII